MTNCDALEKIIDDSGYTMQFLAKQLNITPQGFYNKRKGIREFTVEEMLKLCEILKISKSKREEIFLS